jgi:hypothetical protein
MTRHALKRFYVDETSPVILFLRFISFEQEEEEEEGGGGGQSIRKKLRSERGKKKECQNYYYYSTLLLLFLLLLFTSLQLQSSTTVPPHSSALQFSPKNLLISPPLSLSTEKPLYPPLSSPLPLHFAAEPSLSALLILMIPKPNKKKRRRNLFMLRKAMRIIQVESLISRRLERGIVFLLSLKCLLLSLGNAFAKEAF